MVFQSVFCQNYLFKPWNVSCLFTLSAVCLHGQLFIYSVSCLFTTWIFAPKSWFFSHSFIKISALETSAVCLHCQLFIYFFINFQAIDIFMSSCTVFVFLSLIEYAFVNVMMGDISEVERKDKTSHLRNIIVASNTNLGYSWQQHTPHQPQPKHPSQTQFQGIKVNILQYRQSSI